VVRRLKLKHFMKILTLKLSEKTRVNDKILYSLIISSVFI